MTLSSPNHLLSVLNQIKFMSNFLQMLIFITFKASCSSTTLPCQQNYFISIIQVILLSETLFSMLVLKIDYAV